MATRPKSDKWMDALKVLNEINRIKIVIDIPRNTQVGSKLLFRARIAVI